MSEWLDFRPMVLTRFLNIRLVVITTVCALLIACGEPPVATEAGADSAGHTPASTFTQTANDTVADAMASMDRDDPAISEGLIAAAGPLVITDDQGGVVWDLSQYDFLSTAAPATANPSLWRQAAANNLAGLFKVVDGVYQLRGFDLANMTLIDGERGWIVVDPLTSEETAKAALEFAFQHLPSAPVTAVLFTHSHIDHFGGVFGVTTAEAVASGEVEVIAPEGFMAEATSEMVLAGRVMSRRADFMYGRRLQRSTRGHIGSGLGKQPAIGTVAIAAPSQIITETPESRTIDGVSFVFQNVPGSEAPAEFTFYLPEHRAFCGAELVSRNLHNLYTLRGAKVRDALRWSGYIDEALRLFPDAEVVFNSHHWPIWGEQQVVEFLKQQRDIYKYIHDQTLRLAGQGLGPEEIAETLTLPESLASSFAIRDYYGTVKHNSKAVYQFYFGWYSGNPADLDPLPPTDSAPRYVALMGGDEAVLAAAGEAADVGEYRWAAELLNILVFAEPSNSRAKSMLAGVYDQLGYQAESGPWRDVYLSGAFELRTGAPEESLPTSNVIGLLQETPIERIFELVAATVNGPDAADIDLVLEFHLTDIDRRYTLVLENGVLHHALRVEGDEPSVSLSVTYPLFLRILLGDAEITELISGDDLSITGSKLDLLRFLSLLEPHSDHFNLVTP